MLWGFLSLVNTTASHFTYGTSLQTIQVVIMYTLKHCLRSLKTRTSPRNIKTFLSIEKYNKNNYTDKYISSLQVPNQIP